MPCCRLANLKVSQFQGYGLSFTAFSYSGLHLSSSNAGGAASGHNVTVTVQVQNTGDRDGKEVVQVYSTPPSGAAFPAGAPKQNLVAFLVVAVPQPKIAPMVLTTMEMDSLTVPTLTAPMIPPVAVVVVVKGTNASILYQRSSAPIPSTPRP